MLVVLDCIATQHDPRLVAGAIIICAVGAWASVRLFRRACSTDGLQHWGWLFLTAVAAGSSIWSTHFIAMLAYKPLAPVDFDPVLTIFSLLVAMAGAGIGFSIAGMGARRLSAWIGGAFVGLAIAAMHYTGMLAYRVQGLVTWDFGYVVASVALAAVLTSYAVRLATTGWRATATGVLVLAIVSLHFTGMTAFNVTPLSLSGGIGNTEALHALALAIAMVTLVILASGIASYLIEDSARAESYRELKRMALKDTLTDLPNRANLRVHLDAELDYARTAGGRIALIAIDLNRFKEINDLRGHQAGDEALQILAKRMAEMLRDGEFAARLGGDEFSVVCRMRNHDHLHELISRLLAVFDEPLVIDGLETATGASLGVAIFPDDTQDNRRLASNADLAMYRAKESTMTSVCFYEPSMDAIEQRRRELANDLRTALQDDQLEVHYQVQEFIKDGSISGYEALLRWHHPTRGPIPPAEFIPLAEESGLILDLGEWVLRTACREAARSAMPFKVAVNLSPVQFAHENLPRLVQEILIETGLSPARLELELTESTIAADKVRSLHTLRRIRGLGVAIALDDFGTGFSSLETLRYFPFDRLKLDGTFVRDIEDSPEALAIVRAVLALGNSLGIPVLAEGIETSTQLSTLRREGCREGQGYYLGIPQPLEAIIAPTASASRVETRRESAQTPRTNEQEVPVRSVAVG